jgi:hypothetical protein
MSMLVILGAGASHDSVADHSIGLDRDPEMQPPLAFQLFANRLAYSNLMKGIPRIGAIAATLRDRIARGALIEDELATMDQAATGNPRVAQQLMAVRFYLQRLITMCGDAWSETARGATNYHRLIDAIVGWSARQGEPALVVTFNYDTMLEKAMQQELDFTFMTMESYIERDDIKLFKLHGSVDWGHHARATVNGTINDVIERAGQLEVPTTFEIKRGNWNSGQGGELWVPALAVPVRRKRVFECPDDHLRLLHDLLPTVDLVLVIGWAGQEEHFLDLLRSRLRVKQRGAVVACGPDAGAAHETWSRLAEKDHGVLMTITGPAVLGESLTFSELFAHDGFAEFLAA